MNVVKGPVAAAPVLLVCRKESCRAEFAADVSEGILKVERADRPMDSDYEYYEFTCQFCQSKMRVAKSSVKWERVKA